MTTTQTDLATQLRTWRRHLHQHPELSFQEHETSAYIEAQLRAMPNLIITRPTPTSVLAVLNGGQSGRTVLLRADTDALPIHEDEGADAAYRSTRDGIMHACGHDGHTAILLGVAQELSADPQRVHGEVRFLFQHAEELPPGGAQELVKAGVMRGVDVVTGLHLNSQLPANVVAIKPGAFMAAPDTFHITIQGRGGHGAHPEQTVDPIAIGAQVVTNLQHIASRHVGALDNIIVSVTQFHAGTADNVIPDAAVLAGTVRTFDPALRERAPQLIDQITGGICAAHGATHTLDYGFGYAPLINDAQVAAVLRDVAVQTVGEEWVYDALPTMGGEDFSAYLQEAPGAYLNVGAGNAERGITAPHHHPRFDIDESSLMTGVRVLKAAALRLAQRD
ncbi:amidohydrolase [Deinococcus maricopensis]|uniref:Amidohydrolase n=1 Tax=Deinococcus maricopensis (strain DSM 21211 / LMG 22137 / NRRL B-23946 / LB-34) TaxID=709986 RepID=E8U6F3_DEIML|nr:amidohydrolase [Deinococcus maricopensis]ADV66642.1 amidohydrolase [Deinococcus maricopensis DSM 21211]